MRKKVLVLMAGFLLIYTNLLYAAGDLTVLGKLGVGGENTSSEAKLLVKDTTVGGGPLVALQNDRGTVYLFKYKTGQNDHLSSLPMGSFNYYLFEDSEMPKNREFRVYGYPNGASGLSYGSFQMVGTTADFEIKTGSSSSNILLTPGASANVGIGTAAPTEKLQVAGNVKANAFITGDITFQKDGEKLWRMFEDEDGLYLESVKTGKVYKFILQEVKKK